MVPYSDTKLKDFQILYQVATKGARPRLPSSTPTAWAVLFKRCTDADPLTRYQNKVVGINL